MSTKSGPSMPLPPDQPRPIPTIHQDRSCRSAASPNQPFAASARSMYCPWSAERMKPPLGSRPQMSVRLRLSDLQFNAHKMRVPRTFRFANAIQFPQLTGPKSCIFARLTTRLSGPCGSRAETALVEGAVGLGGRGKMGSDGIDKRLGRRSAHRVDDREVL